MLDFAFQKMKLVMRAGWGYNLKMVAEQGRTEVRKNAPLQQPNKISKCLLIT